MVDVNANLVGRDLMRLELQHLCRKRFQAHLFPAARRVLVVLAVLRAPQVQFGAAAGQQQVDAAARHAGNLPCGRVERDIEAVSIDGDDAPSRAICTGFIVPGGERRRRSCNGHFHLRPRHFVARFGPQRIFAQRHRHVQQVMRPGFRAGRL